MFDGVSLKQNLDKNLEQGAFRHSHIFHLFNLSSSHKLSSSMKGPGPPVSPLAVTGARGLMEVKNADQPSHSLQQSGLTGENLN